MSHPAPEEHAAERSRKPHWRRSNFWKTFGMMLVIYLSLRILITLVLDRPGAPAEITTGSGPESSPTAQVDSPAPENSSE